MADQNQSTKEDDDALHLTEEQCLALLAQLDKTERALRRMMGENLPDDE